LKVERGNVAARSGKNKAKMDNCDNGNRSSATSGKNNGASRDVRLGFNGTEMLK
jgi:hypothetical protein